MPGQVPAGNAFLGAGPQILHGHHARGHLVGAHDHGEGDAGPVGVLELPGDLGRFQVDLGIDPPAPELSRQGQVFGEQGRVELGHQHLDGAGPRGR